MKFPYVLKGCMIVDVNDDPPPKINYFLIFFVPRKGQKQINTWKLMHKAEIGIKIKGFPVG
jgi:hypothetical protein